MRIWDFEQLKDGDTLVVARDFNNFFSKYGLSVGREVTIVDGETPYVKEEKDYGVNLVIRVRAGNYNWWVYTDMLERPNKKGHKLTKIFS